MPDGSPAVTAMTGRRLVTARARPSRRRSSGWRCARAPIRARAIDVVRARHAATSNAAASARRSASKSALASASLRLAAIAPRSRTSERSTSRRAPRASRSRRSDSFFANAAEAFSCSPTGRAGGREHGHRRVAIVAEVARLLGQRAADAAAGRSRQRTGGGGIEPRAVLEHARDVALGQRAESQAPAPRLHGLARACRDTQIPGSESRTAAALRAS